MQEKQYDANNQGHMNESGGYVKCEESKQPKNDQNCSDYPKHVFVSLFLRERTPAIMFPLTAVMIVRVRENNLQTEL